jgi:hypothetical protein
MLSPSRSFLAVACAFSLLGAACSDAPTPLAPAVGDTPAVLNTYPAPAASVSNSGGTPLISWSALAGATSYSVTQVIIETETNRQTAESNQWRYETLLGSTTGTSYLDTSNVYTGDWLCSYNNYPIVLRYTYRYEITATFPGGTSRTSIFAPIASC